MGSLTSKGTKGRGAGGWALDGKADSLSLHQQQSHERAAFTLAHALVGLQVNGHFMANLDPLGLDRRPMPVELDPALYGFSDKDLDRECVLCECAKDISRWHIVCRLTALHCGSGRGIQLHEFFDTHLHCTW